MRVERSHHGPARGTALHNREHVWARSRGSFDTVPGPGTDVHHLRPEDVTVNSDRGNLDFGHGRCGPDDPLPGRALRGRRDLAVTRSVSHGSMTAWKAPVASWRT